MIWYLLLPSHDHSGQDAGSPAPIQAWETKENRAREGLSTDLCRWQRDRLKQPLPAPLGRIKIRLVTCSSDEQRWNWRTAPVLLLLHSKEVWKQGHCLPQPAQQRQDNPLQELQGQCHVVWGLGLLLGECWCCWWCSCTLGEKPCKMILLWTALSIDLHEHLAFG